MKLEGTVMIAAPPSAVWTALNDPAVLARCIEGVQSLSRVTDETGERFEGKMNAKVGPVRATFTGHVMLKDVIDGASYRLVGEGKGGVAGFAKGEADVTLSPAPAGHTTLEYAVRSSVGGKLAQLGARLIEGTAKAYATGFFEKLKVELETGEAPTDVPVQPPVTDSVSSPEAADSKGLSPLVWAGLLIVAVLVFLVLQWM